MNKTMKVLACIILAAISLALFFALAGMNAARRGKTEAETKTEDTHPKIVKIVRDADNPKQGTVTFRNKDDVEVKMRFVIPALKKRVGQYITIPLKEYTELGGTQRGDVEHKVENCIVVYEEHPDGKKRTLSVLRPNNSPTPKKDEKSK